MDGQVKVGIRNGLVILLFVVIGVPLLKNAVAKVQQVPEPVRNWVLAI